MDKTSFWSLIEEAKREGDDDCDLMADLLISRLVLLPAEEIVQFREIQNDYLAIIHRLGEVYSLLTGLPMSDDASDYFCMWVIKQGRAICEAAWDNPGVLADAPLDEDGYPDCEPLLYVADRAFKIRTGEPRPALANEPWLLPLDDPTRQEGRIWTKEELEASYPGLWDRFRHP